MKIIDSLFIIILLAWCTEEISGLSCLECDRTPCEDPVCCDSGQLSTDLCGCCKACSKGENDVCGGPFRSSGDCRVGMSCYKSCTCVTISEKKCIFPFKYKGKTYYTCTTVDSLNFEPWCALERDRNGNVIDGKWEDCKDCSRADFDTSKSCGSADLFQSEGICVKNSVRRQIETIFRDNAVQPIYEFDSGSRTSNPTAQCSLINEFHCHCAKRDTQDVTPCLKSADNSGTLLDYGYCFLENVADFNDPTKDCYPDVEWSKSHGRFWSNLACKEEGADIDFDNARAPPIIDFINTDDSAPPGKSLSSGN